MTITISNHDPAPNAVNVSPHIHPRFRLNSDGPAIVADSIETWLNGMVMVSELRSTGVGGFDVIIHPPGPFIIEDLVTMRVRVVSFEETWTFDVADARGPILAEASPPPGSIATSSPSNLTGRLSDPGTGHDPVPRLIDFRAGDVTFDAENIYLYPTFHEADGSAAVGDDYFDSAGDHVFTDDDIGKSVKVGGHTLRIVGRDSGSRVRLVENLPVAFVGVDWHLVNHSLMGKEGQLFEVTNGPSVGERRRITEVQSHIHAIYDGAVVDGDELDLYSNRGLNIHVDGLLVVHAGFLDADAALAGWTATIGADDFDIGVPVTWVAGDRVHMHVQATDDNTALLNTSDINYFFDVIDVRGPKVLNVTPAEGGRGLGLTDDLQFDILCSEDVDNTSIQVRVNNSDIQANAVRDGVGFGDWSTSTVTPVTDGYRIVLKKPSGYTDGEIAFVDIQSRDDSVPGRDGERRVLRFHFGDTASDAVVAHGLSNDIVRVLAYDLTETSFGDPVRLRHTGYAWDGFWYTDGSKLASVDGGGRDWAGPGPSYEALSKASWHTELGDFLLAGLIVVTATGGWAIVRAGGGTWMSCAPATAPAWSMAGNGTTTDAAFGPDAVLMLGGNVNIVVDFVRDRSEKLAADGRTICTQTITQRNDDQSGALDQDYIMASFVTDRLAGIRTQDSLVLAMAHGPSVTVVHDLGDERRSELGAEFDALPGTVVTTRSETRWSSATWRRLMIKADHMLMAYDDAGQGQVELWHWFRFLIGEAEDLFLDDGTTPALPSEAVADMDFDETRLVVAMAHTLVIVDRLSLAKVEYDEATLGLVVAGASLSALSAEREQYMVATAAVADGRVVRFRPPDDSLVMHDGTPFSTIAAVGSALVSGDRYVATRMEVVS